MKSTLFAAPVAAIMMLLLFSCGNQAERLELPTEIPAGYEAVDTLELDAGYLMRHKHTEVLSYEFCQNWDATQKAILIDASTQKWVPVHLAEHFTEVVGRYAAFSAYQSPDHYVILQPVFHTDSLAVLLTGGKMSDYEGYYRYYLKPVDEAEKALSDAEDEFYRQRNAFRERKSAQRAGKPQSEESMAALNEEIKKHVDRVYQPKVDQAKAKLVEAKAKLNRDLRIVILAEVAEGGKE